MCRDAELAARDYLRMVLGGIGPVGDVSMVQTLLRQADAALHRYTDPSWRPDGLALTGGALRGLMELAAPGSDVQLAYAQAFIGVALSPGDLDLLAGMLDGTRAVEGLTVDTELRWRILHRLVSRGAAGGAAIEAELARDATDAGARHAASCRASVPDPAAKEAAWEQIVGGTLPNATFRAMLAGFMDHDQPGLLAPYVDRYFAVVSGLWRDWTPDMARWFVSYAYPSTDDPAVIDEDQRSDRRERPARGPGPAAGRRAGRAAPRAALPGARPAGGRLSLAPRAGSSWSSPIAGPITPGDRPQS